MIEFGKTLRAAREAKGLTVEQLAKSTRMLSRVVNDLENEDFSHLPAPIYGRGFVKLYCEEVGLDPKPMIAEFMEILNNRRDGDDRSRRDDPAPIKPAPIKPAPIQPAPVAQPEPIAAAEPPPMPAIKPVPADDLFSLTAAEPEPISEPPPTAAPILPKPATVPPAPAKEAAPKASRYAAAYGDLLADEDGAGWAPSPSIWRWAVVAVVAIAFAVLVAMGLRALYRATASAPAPIDDTTAAALGESEKAAKPTQAAAAKARTKAADEPRTPMDIPSLYID